VRSQHERRVPTGADGAAFSLPASSDSASPQTGPAFSLPASGDPASPETGAAFSLPASGDPASPETGADGLAFSLPAVDDPASTETGVIILGLEVRQLLAALGLAALAEDPTAVALLADQARHTGTAAIALGDLVALGVRRWRAEREALGSPPGHRASLRQGWALAYRTVEPCRCAAVAAYLTACWLRRAEVDGYPDPQPPGP
jgi:Family of unknown function (DUF6187)